MGRERRTYTIDGEEVGPAEWRTVGAKHRPNHLGHNRPLVMRLKGDLAPRVFNATATLTEKRQEPGPERHAKQRDDHNHQCLV